MNNSYYYIIFTLNLQTDTLEVMKPGVATITAEVNLTNWAAVVGLLPDSKLLQMELAAPLDLLSLQLMCPLMFSAPTQGKASTSKAFLFKPET